MGCLYLYSLCLIGEIPKMSHFKKKKTLFGNECVSFNVLAQNYPSTDPCSQFISIRPKKQRSWTMYLVIEYSAVLNIVSLFFRYMNMWF